MSNDTQKQIDEGLLVLKPLLEDMLEVRPDQKFDIKCIWTPDEDGKTGSMHWEMTIDGKDLSKGQEVIVQSIFNAIGSRAVPIKAKA